MKKTLVALFAFLLIGCATYQHHHYYRPQPVSYVYIGGWYGGWYGGWWGPVYRYPVYPRYYTRAVPAPSTNRYRIKENTQNRERPQSTRQERERPQVQPQQPRRTPPVVRQPAPPAPKTPVNSSSRRRRP